MAKSNSKKESVAKLKVLLLEDDARDAQLIESMLEAEGLDFETQIVETRTEFLTALGECQVDVVLADFALPQFDGKSALRIARTRCPELPFIFVSGVMGEEVAIESLKEGATDYVLKNRINRLGPAVRRALREAEDRRRRKQAEDRLKEHVIELARSNAELEQYAYVASHDLQEPLRKVANFAELLEKRYRNQLDETADKYIHYIVDGVRRMQGLIQDLLNYSKLHRSKQNLAPTSLKAIMNQIITDMEVTIRESNARIIYKSLPTVQANPVQFKQLLQNLIANAIKYHGKADPVVEITAAEKKHEWLLSVKDNGIGFEQEFSDRIFVIFQRLHSPNEFSGTGVGLAICKKIVERHGGRIWAESQPGKGATFFFTIPKNPGKNSGKLFTGDLGKLHTDLQSLSKKHKDLSEKKTRRPSNA